MSSYFMESAEEEIRLELKTNEESVRSHALWCGLQPGMRVLDAGCGSGKTSCILHDMAQPGGSVLGIDFSERRVDYARKKFRRPGLDFEPHDLKKPLEGIGEFDFVWTCFVLEYFRRESQSIVDNLARCLKPGGRLCLLDLDSNMMNHYDLPKHLEKFFCGLIRKITEDHNFDPFCGRKLYSYMYDLGFEQIRVNLVPHHLIYGEVRELDFFNWLKKVEVSAEKESGEFQKYPGGYPAFAADFEAFFRNPRRFTYTPLVICTGVKPLKA